MKPVASSLRYRHGAGPPSTSDFSAVAWYGQGVWDLRSDRQPGKSLGYVANDFYLQDAASLLPLKLLALDTGDLPDQTWVCDLCAAPGGKATAILESIGPRGFLVANEVVAKRRGALAENLARVGSGRYVITGSPPETLAKWLPHRFDIVVVDAPCSGQSMVAIDKQDPSAFDAETIAANAKRQHAILDAAAGLLRPGGTLVYSTCTFAEAENEAQVQRLVESERFMPTGDAIGNAVGCDVRSTGPGCYRIDPRVRSEDHGGWLGGFVASMQSSPSASDTKMTDPSRRRPPSRFQCRYDSSWPSEAWAVPAKTGRQFFQTDDTIYIQDDDVPPEVLDLAVGGPTLARRRGKSWRPSHSWALRRDVPHRAQQISFDAQTAASYIGGESIDGGSEAAFDDPGWAIAGYRDRPLGWVKVSGGTAKNHYPRSLRQRLKHLD